MKDYKNWVIVGLLVLVAAVWLHESKPQRPFLKWLGGAFKTAIWVAPLVLDEQPQNVQSVTQPQFAYGAAPKRSVGADGYEVIEHGENW